MNAHNNHFAERPRRTDSPSGFGSVNNEQIDDLSALSWVQDELRRTLEVAHKALRRFKPPFALPSFSFQQAWHVRRQDDPGHRWLREAVLASSQPSGG